MQSLTHGLSCDSIELVYRIHYQSSLDVVFLLQAGTKKQLEDAERVMNERVERVFEKMIFEESPSDVEEDKEEGEEGEEVEVEEEEEEEEEKKREEKCTVGETKESKAESQRIMHAPVGLNMLADVVLHSLTSETDLNGLHGECVGLRHKGSLDSSEMRWLVKLESDFREVFIKPGNLTLVCSNAACRAHLLPPLLKCARCKVTKESSYFSNFYLFFDDSFWFLPGQNLLQQVLPGCGLEGRAQE